MGKLSHGRGSGASTTEAVRVSHSTEFMAVAIVVVLVGIIGFLVGWAYGFHDGIREGYVRRWK
jgi:hypothetical protein